MYRSAYFEGVRRARPILLNEFNAAGSAKLQGRNYVCMCKIAAFKQKRLA